MYQIEHGDKIEAIIQQCRRGNLPLPTLVLNAPRLRDGLDFIYSAFVELGSCRQLGMAEGMIPWTAIREYAVTYGITDQDDFEYFTNLIKAMDFEYIKFRAKQAEAKTKK